MSKIKKNKICHIINNHILNNKREYFIIIILFFIGIIASVFFINNVNDEQFNNMQEYINNLINIENYSNINLFNLFKKSIFENISIILLLWIGATTIIGIPIVYGSILFKGFSIGCSICSIISVVGVWKGILFSILLLLLHNIVFIPTIFATSVSGIKLYKSIMNNKKRENIKLEVLRHTSFCLIMILLMIISSIIETYISTNLFILGLKI